MSRTVRFQRQSQAEFAKHFSALCTSRNAWELWSDFITISAVAIANAVDREGPIHNEREQEYLRLINRYDSEEQTALSKLFAMMVLALEENPCQDFLGEMFMTFNLGSHWHGQFFTPYHICELMAKMTMSDAGKHIEARGWIGISDPCCGAGALLIAARNEMGRQGYGSTAALYIAQDIDRTAALMCYVQLSLLGCAGYVVVGDSLTSPIVSPTGTPLLIAPQPEQEIWFMPVTILETWQARVQWERLRLSLASVIGDHAADAPAPHREEATPPLNETGNGQLTLF